MTGAIITLIKQKQTNKLNKHKNNGNNESTTIHCKLQLSYNTIIMMSILVELIAAKTPPPK